MGQLTTAESSRMLAVTVTGPDPEATGAVADALGAGGLGVVADAAATPLDPADAVLIVLDAAVPPTATDRAIVAAIERVTGRAVVALDRAEEVSPGHSPALMAAHSCGAIAVVAVRRPGHPGHDGDLERLATELRAAAQGDRRPAAPEPRTLAAQHRRDWAAADRSARQRRAEGQRRRHSVDLEALVDDHIHQLAAASTRAAAGSATDPATAAADLATLASEHAATLAQQAGTGTLPEVPAPEAPGAGRSVGWGELALVAVAGAAAGAGAARAAVAAIGWAAGGIADSVSAAVTVVIAVAAGAGAWWLRDRARKRRDAAAHTAAYLQLLRRRWSTSLQLAAAEAPARTAGPGWRARQLSAGPVTPAPPGTGEGR